MRFLTLFALSLFLEEAGTILSTQIPATISPLRNGRRNEMIRLVFLLLALLASPVLVAGVARTLNRIQGYTPRDGADAFTDAFPAIIIVGAVIGITFSWLAGWL